MEWKVEIFYHLIDLESGLNYLEKEHWVIKNIFFQPIDENRSYFYVVARQSRTPLKLDIDAT